ILRCLNGHLAAVATSRDGPPLSRGGHRGCERGGEGSLDVHLVVAQRLDVARCPRQDLRRAPLLVLAELPRLAQRLLYRAPGVIEFGHNALEVAVGTGRLRPPAGTHATATGAEILALAALAAERPVGLGEFAEAVHLLASLGEEIQRRIDRLA